MDLTLEHNRFKHLLDEINISQRELAAILDCNESYISRMVNGKVPITYKTLHKIKNKISNFDIDFVKQGVKYQQVQKKNLTDVTVKESANEEYLQKNKDETGNKDKIIENLLEIISVYQRQERERIIREQTKGNKGDNHVSGSSVRVTKNRHKHK